jgi:hypothetical protein
MDQAKYAFWMRNHDLLPALGPTNNNPGVAPIGNPNGIKFSGLMVYHTNAAQCNDQAGIWDDLVFDDNSPVAGSPTHPAFGTPYAAGTKGAQTVAWLNAAGNKCTFNVDPMLRGVSREFRFAALDPRPCINSPALSYLHYVANPNDGFFDQTNYVGAFDANNLWCDGWTKLSQMGCLSGNLSTFPENAIVFSNFNIDIGYTINNPSVFPVNASVTLDNYDITSTVLPILAANNGVMNCGGIWAKIPGVPASALASIPANCTPGQQYNYWGLHTLKTTFYLNTGDSLTGTSRFKIAD